jgi:hypothetical protein
MEKSDILWRNTNGIGRGLADEWTDNPAGRRIRHDQQ